ncbi:MAG: hypothetical protein ABSF51_07650 [Verrucomicrobiota bacterium]|jgi:hypothetical protein
MNESSKSKACRFAGLLGWFGCMIFYFLAAQCAKGYMEVIQINHTNLKTYCSFLKIKAVPIHQTNNECIVFTVSVIPTEKQQSDLFEGILYIGTTNDFVAQASVQPERIFGGAYMPERILGSRLAKDIPKQLKAKCVMFQFDVGVKYLAKSQFTVEEIPGPGGGTAYTFDLKDFADDK